MSYIICDDGPLGSNTPYVMSDSGEKIAVAIMDLDKASRSEWLEMRKWGLGGSDLGVAMGHPGYKTLAQMNATKGPNGITTEFDNEAMRWGRKLEAPVAEMATEDLLCRTIRFPYMLQSLSAPALLANVDYLTTGSIGYEPGVISDLDPGLSTTITCVLEIKTTGITGRPNSLVDGILPKGYAAQVLHYCATLGIEDYIVAVLAGGHGLRLIGGRVTSDDIDNAEKCAQMWAEQQSWFTPRYP
jgi:putative phage-type endonuclease